METVKGKWSGLLHVPPVWDSRLLTALSTCASLILATGAKAQQVVLSVASVLVSDYSSVARQLEVLLNKPGNPRKGRREPPRLRVVL